MVVKWSKRPVRLFSHNFQFFYAHWNSLHLSVYQLLTEMGYAKQMLNADSGTESHTCVGLPSPPLHLIGSAAVFLFVFTPPLQQSTFESEELVKRKEILPAKTLLPRMLLSQPCECVQIGSFNQKAGYILPLWFSITLLFNSWQTTT